MGVPPVVVVCIGAVLLTVVAHVVVRLTGHLREDDHVPTQWFAVGVCALAFGALMGRLAGAAAVLDVVLLIGTAAVVLLAAMPLVAALDLTALLTGEPREGRADRRSASRAADPSRRRGLRSAARAPQPALARKGRRVLPPTPFAAPEGRGRASGAAQGGRVDGARLDAARVDGARVAAREAVTEPLPRVTAAGASAGAPGPDAARLGAAQAQQHAADAATAAAERLARGESTPQPERTQPLPPHVQQASDTLERLDRVVDDIAGVLRLGPDPS